MNIDEEDEVDSIMDEDEPEPSEAGEGEHWERWMATEKKAQPRNPKARGAGASPSSSFLDRSVRIEMDSPVFHKLHEAIEHPCRSRK